MRFWKGNQLCDTETFGSCSLTSSNIFCQPFLVLNCSRLKVTAYLQGCLACKRCSASSLNCRYLKPYIKSKLIGLVIRRYQQFWKEMNFSNFSRQLNASAQITLWTLHVRANFLFRLFNVSLSFRAQNTKKRSAICHIQFQRKVTEQFRNRIKKIWSVRTKIALIEKLFRKKKSQTRFVVYVLIYPLSKFGGNLTNSLWVLAFYSVRLKSKN